LNQEERLSIIAAVDAELCRLHEEKTRALGDLEEQVVSFKKVIREKQVLIRSNWERDRRKLVSDKKRLVQVEASMKWSKKNLEKFKEYQDRYNSKPEVQEARRKRHVENYYKRKDHGTNERDISGDIESTTES
jgi:hypothetical protein